MDDEKEQTLDSMMTDLTDALARERRRLQDDRKEILADREKLEAEKEAMMKSGATDGDVLELDVGGEIFKVQRGTLLLAPEDSHLHAMFSGRWEDSLSRTKEGTIFVDMSPHVFRVILSRLRDSKLKAKPATWSGLKASDPIYQNELQSVLEFFGLVDPVPPTPLIVMLAVNGGIDIVDGRKLTKNGPIGHKVAISSEAMPVGSVWKIHVTSLLNNNWIMAGIIGASATPNQNSYNDPTSFGWGNTQVYVSGADNTGKDGWVGWEANDVAIFKLESTSLKMHHMRLQRTFPLQLSSGSLWKIHLNMHGSGDRVELLVPTDQETGILD